MERKYLLVLGLALVVSTGGVLAGRSSVAHKEDKSLQISLVPLGMDLSVFSGP
jgi:hypothetical protein